MSLSEHTETLVYKGTAPISILGDGKNEKDSFSLYIDNQLHSQHGSYTAALEQAIEIVNEVM